MRFVSLFDLRYFLKGVENSITDAELLKRVKFAKDNEIQDKDYFLLSDSTESFIGELKLYSEKKEFYKALQNDQLDSTNLKHIFSMLTHISIGLNERLAVRKDVSFDSYLELKGIADSLVLEILSKGSVDNKLKILLS